VFGFDFENGSKADEFIANKSIFYKVMANDKASHRTLRINMDKLAIHMDKLARTRREA